MTQGSGDQDAALEADVVTDVIREAIEQRAARLGIDPQSVISPSPRAVCARTRGGDLLRLDVSAYHGADLDR